VPGHDSFFDGRFSETEYALLTAQTSDPGEYDAFLQHCMDLLVINAGRSLNGNQPNYWLDTATLLNRIGSDLGSKIQVEGIPSTITTELMISLKDNERILMMNGFPI